MKKIRELLVVEGRHDKDRLEKLFDATIVMTGGLSMDENTLKLVAEADRQNGVIIFTDPDTPGQKIRDQLAAVAPHAKHVFVEKKDAIGKRNVGVEYVSDEKLLALLEQTVTFTDGNESISRQEYLALGLTGDGRKRDYLTSQLHIGKCNNKRLFKYLNMMGVSARQVKEILEKDGK